MDIEIDATKPATFGTSSPIRRPVAPADGECEPTGLEFAFSSFITTQRIHQCEETTSEAMPYDRKSRATHTFRDTIGNGRRAHKASSHGRRSGHEFLLVNPETNVVDSQMATKCQVLRPRPRRPKPNGISRRRRDDHDLAYDECFGYTLSEGSDTMIGEPRRRAFGHHVHETSAAEGDGSIKDSHWLDVNLPFATKVSPSPPLFIDLDSVEDHISPIRLSMKRIPPDLDILSVVTGSTKRWTEDATPPPATYDPLWGAVLTLSSNEASTMTPQATYSSLR